MMSAGNFIIKHCKVLLENKQQAILFAVVLSILPFASWLSVALVCLITLRKGAQSGFEVMLPALVVHSVPLMMLVPLESVLANTLIAYIPCYIAALSLRKTVSLQRLSGVFFIQACIGFLLIQYLAPDFVTSQFEQFKKILAPLQVYQQLLLESSDRFGSFMLAQLFFGIHILTVIASSLFSLLFARSIQAKLFNPGAFSEEISKFRCGKISFLILVIVLLASYYEIPSAINLLPLVLCYFLLSGFNLAYYITARKNHFRVVILLLLLIVFKPSIVLLAYVIIGSLDSLFNFRLYLPARVREST